MGAICSCVENLFESEAHFDGKSNKNSTAPMNVNNFEDEKIDDVKGAEPEEDKHKKRSRSRGKIAFHQDNSVSPKKRITPTPSKNNSEIL